MLLFMPCQVGAKAYQMVFIRSPFKP